MRAAAQQHGGLHWSALRVPLIHGLGDTRIKTGEDYETRPLLAFWKLAPTAKPKHQAFAILPSLHHGYDAREHAAQREQGQFVALMGDIDKGDHPLTRVQELVEGFAVGAAWSIYSTASATPSDRRWRVVVPLDTPVPFATWYDAQLALSDHMAAAGVVLDTCAARPGQVSFLPNVPRDMRDSAGEPQFFEQSATGVDLPGLRFDAGPIAGLMVAIERKRAEDDAERERIRQEAEKRRKARPISSDDGSVIDTFNRANSVENLLQLYEYEQSSRDRRDWRSRYQTSGSYATRVLDGGKWVSLSGSDAAARVGAQCSSGCYGDAFDLFLHYDHGGDYKAAWRAACAEQGRERPHRSGQEYYQAQDAYQSDDQSWRDAANDQGPADERAGSAAQQQAGKRPIKATPFVWRDPATIPPRKWLYSTHLIRKFLSLDIAPGGLGKSSVKIVESLAMASGRELLGKPIHEGALRVWLYNLEDPAEETERRIHAAALHYGIGPDEIDGRLFVDSGRDQPICIAEETPDGVRIVHPVSEAVIAELVERRIDVLSIDPFVSSHAISENDNRAIDMVAKEWSRIADICDCAINLVHHVRKTNGTEVTAESSRGAVSLIGAARSVIVYNRMTKEEAERAGIEPSKRSFYFRMQNDKANLAPSEAADWVRMNNVDLPNGDKVGVACPWQWPDAFAGLSTRDLYEVQLAIAAAEWGSDTQAKDWGGQAVANALSLDVEKDKGRIKDLIKTWISTKALGVERRTNANGRERPYLVVGSWVDPATLNTSQGVVRKV